MRKHGLVVLRIITLFAMLLTMITQPFVNAASAASPYANYLSFDGADDTVALSGLAVNTAAGGKNTVQFWMNWNGVNPVMPFGWAGSYDLEFASGYFGFNTGFGEVYGISSASLKNQWVHVTAIFTNGMPDTNELYINGVKQTLVRYLSTNATSRSASTTAFISGWGRSTGYKFSGSLADVRIWNYARTPEEIQADPYAVLSGDEQGLIGYYKLHSIATGKVYSASANNPNPGVSSGFPAPQLFPNTTSLTDTTATLEWSPLSQATSYTLMRDGKEIYSGTDAVFADSQLTPSTAYQYGVIAKNSFGESRPVPYSVTTRAASLTIPTNFTGTPGTNQVDLKWDPVTNATGYVLKRNGEVIYTGAQSSYTDLKLLAATDYEYTIFATATDAESQPATISVRTNSLTLTEPSNSIVMDAKDDEYRLTNLAVNTAAGGRNTVEFWMNWNGATAAMMPFGWDSGYDLEFVNGFFGFNSSENNVIGISSSSLKNRWVHVAAVFYNGVPTLDNLELYINGQKQVLQQAIGPVARYTKSATPGAYLSGWGRSTGYKFGGKIANLRIWNQARTQSEIQMSMNNDIITSATGLIGSWNPDPISTGLVYDQSGRNHGIAKGFAQPAINPTVASKDAANITLQWQKVATTQPISYQLKRDGALVYEGDATTFQDTNLEANKEYTYTLIAKDLLGESAPFIVTAKTDQATLPVPTSLAGVPTHDTVSLTWDDSTDPSVTYAVYRNDALIYTGDANSFTDSGLTAETEYTYSVYAKKDTLSSAPATVIVKTLPAPVVIPAAPTNLKAVPSQDTVTLTWDASQDATVTYSVYRGDAAVYNGPAATFTDTKLQPSTSYTYKVTASNTAGASEPAMITTRTLAPVLAPPTNIRKTENETSIALDWDQVTGATSYEVYRNGIKLGNAYYSEYFSEFTESNLTPGTTYTYSIVSKNSTSTSQPSTVTATTKLIATAPAAPVNLKVTNVSYNSVAITWDADAQATSYRILRNGSYSGTSYTNSYTDKSASSQQTYNYTVVAINRIGESTASAPLSVTTPSAPAPAAVTNLRTTDVKDVSVSIAWDHVATGTANEYHIYRNGTKVTSNSIAFSNSNTYKDTNVKPDTDYTYTVYAYNYGTLSPAATITVRTLPPSVPYPATPVNLQGVPTSSSVALTWEPSENAASYYITRNNSLIKTVTTNSYTDTNLTADKSYTYGVIAVNSIGLQSNPATITVKTLGLPPATPTSFTAVTTEYHATLSWTAVSGATTYELKRDNQVVYTGSATSFTNESLTPATTYTYTLTAKNTAGSSQPATLSVTTKEVPPATAVPSTPTNFAANPTASNVTLAWNAADQAKTYELKRDGQVIYTGTQTTYADYNIQSDRTYVYTLTAVNELGASEPASLRVTTPNPYHIGPNAPTNLTGETTETSATLTWDPALSDTWVYFISRDGQPIADNVKGNTFTDNGLTPGNTYEYSVTAFNAWDWSTATVITVTTKVPAPVAPQAPTNFAAVTTDQTAALTWDASANAATYELKRGNQVIYSGPNVSFTDTGLTPSTAYTYTLTAKNDTGTSEAVTLTVTTKESTAVPATPTNFRGTAGDTYISLTWNQVSGATSYEVKKGSTVMWTGTNNSISANNLTPSTTYTFTVVAINQYGKSAPATITVTTLAPPPPETGVPTPQNFRGEATDNGIVLTWDAVPIQAGYYLERNDGWFQFLSGRTTTFTDTEVEPGVTYTYQIFTDDGENPLSQPATVTVTAKASTTQPPQMATPVNLAAEATEQGIRLTWDAVADAESYDIVRTGGEEFFTMTNSNSYLDTSVTPGVTYTYYIKANHSEMMSSEQASITARALDAAPVVTIPATPVNFAGAAEETSATLTWDAVSGALSYELKRDDQVIYTGTDTSYTDQGLTASTTYTYTVAAVNEAGVSAAATTSVTTKTPVPPAPVLATPELKASLNGSTANLSWNDVAADAEYELKRNGTTIYKGKSTSFQDSNLPAASEFYYVLRATLGTASAEDDATLYTLANRPRKAEVLEATETSLTFTWDTNGNPATTEYKVVADNGFETGWSTDIIVTMTGLAPAEHYKIWIVARSKDGVETKSEFINAKTAGKNNNK
ncbi:fibronectin type III domain-containing protein [Brevibacillus dissolubilis]|uniref:fibronectin type III domain-containing protein n=1 Tax=Brevibacillus dissolubilis TaxID=1844116 RepID=UPI00159BC8E5|nr:LamG-like jellyroll fold domain-containing protein [Brevibacillus dissolubilis]